MESSDYGLRWPILRWGPYDSGAAVSNSGTTCCASAQNAMLNQQLQTQDQSHINHLQQLSSIHQPPHTVNPPVTTSPMPSHPSVPEPSTPAAVPATHSGPTTSLSSEALLQEVKNTVESSLQAMVGKPSEHPVQSTSPPVPLPTPPVQFRHQRLLSLPSLCPRWTNNHHSLSQASHTDPGPIAIVNSPSTQTSVLCPSIAALVDDPLVDPGDHHDRELHPETDPVDGKTLDLVTEHLRSTFDRQHPDDMRNATHRRTTTNHMTTPPPHQLFILHHGGTTNNPPNPTTLAHHSTIKQQIPTTSGSPGASGKTTPDINHRHTNPRGSTTPHPIYQTLIHVTTPPDPSLPTRPLITPLTVTDDDTLQPFQETTNLSPPFRPYAHQCSLRHKRRMGAVGQVRPQTQRSHASSIGFHRS